MKLHDVRPSTGSRKSKIRRGRGDGSTRGNYSGRGMNGQNARSGGGVRLGFEGGQTPILRRIPKLKGFKNINTVEFLAINLKTIDEKYSDGEVVSPETLLEKRIIRNLNKPVKILGEGKLTKKVTFEGVKMSKSAEKAGSAKKAAPKKKEEKEEVVEESADKKKEGEE